MAAAVQSGTRNKLTTCTCYRKLEEIQFKHSTRILKYFFDVMQLKTNATATLKQDFFFYINHNKYLGHLISLLRPYRWLLTLAEFRWCP